MAWAGVLGATGVAMGAFGAHALKGSLEASGTLGVWETASRYQLVHAAALLGLAGWLRSPPAPMGSLAAWTVKLWAAGTILFSGSLYALALGGPRWLGPATPLGGAALIAGWLFAAGAAFAA
jgi:uncharacterized membrane protein YgdD (TMEM256/DUF423 family)